MRRPRSVTIVSILLLFYGLALFALAGLFVLLLLWPEAIEVERAELRSLLTEVSRLDVVLLGGNALIGLFMMIGGLGLLRLRGWAWLLAIIGLGVHLLILLIDYWRGDPTYFMMLFSALLCFFLNLREIKQTLGLIEDPGDNTRPHDAWDASADAPESRSLFTPKSDKVTR